MERYLAPSKDHVDDFYYYEGRKRVRSIQRERERGREREGRRRWKSLVLETPTIYPEGRIWTEPPCMLILP